MYLIQNIASLFDIAAHHPLKTVLTVAGIAGMGRFIHVRTLAEEIELADGPLQNEAGGLPSGFIWFALGTMAMLASFWI